MVPQRPERLDARGLGRAGSPFASCIDGVRKHLACRSCAGAQITDRRSLRSLHEYTPLARPNTISTSLICKEVAIRALDALGPT
jgi:hypothetical protein